MTYGNYIKEARKRQGLNQSEFAERLHCSYVTLSKWEREKYVPDAKSIAKIEDVLGLNNCELYRLIYKSEKNALCPRLAPPRTGGGLTKATA